MKAKGMKNRKQKESGVALLIAIFVLMLVSVVAISLIMASGGESALAGNYRASSASYLAAVAGIEEARGRMLPKNADYFNKTTANFIPTSGTLAVGQVRYILNPGPGESASSLLTTYPDNEYATEFGSAPSSSNTQSLASVSTVTSNGTTYYGPLFKWVRINAATEKSIGTDVNQDGTIDSTTPLYFDPTHTTALGTTQPSLIVPPMVAGVPNLTATPNARQAYQVTAYAQMPDGSKKTVQYVIAPVTYPVNFPSAVTLAGNSITFNGANSNQYYVNGTDGSGSPPAVAGCNPTGNSYPAVGTTSGPDVANIIAGIPGNRDNHYTGGGLGQPSVGNVSLAGGLQTPADLNNMVTAIEANADLVITGNATQANMPSNMSASNPMVVVVDGNFSMSGNYSGYGLLVVTGNFSYTGNTGWAGIVLVIGQGTTTFSGSGGGNAEFDGAIFAATTKDISGNTLSSFGTTSFDISGGGGNGIYYNSCWINQANQPPSYQVLSFRELH